MSSAVIRVLSPALGSITATITSTAAGDPASETASTARQSALMGAGSVSELIELLPADYKPVLTDPIHALVTLVSKLSASRTTLAKWEAHKVARTFPPHLRGTAPRVSLVSEFSNTAGGNAAKTRLDAAFTEYQSLALDESIRAKKDEVAALVLGLEPATVWEQFRTLVDAQKSNITERYKQPTTEMDPATRAIRVTGWEVTPAARLAHHNMMSDCAAVAMRAISLTESSNARKALKIKKKVDLAAAARTAAGDVDVTMTPAAPSIQSMVDKAVNAALKKQAPQGQKRKRDQDGGNSGANKKSKDDKIAALKVSYDLDSCDADDADDFLAASCSRALPAPRRTTKVRPAPLQTHAIPSFTPVRDQEVATRAGRRQVGRQSRPQAIQRSKQKSEGKPQGKERLGSWQSASMDSRVPDDPSMSGASSPAVRAWGPSQDLNYSTTICRPGSYIALGDLWISSPSLMPDYLIDLPTPHAIDIILRKMSLEMLSSLSYQQYIHQSPGVHLSKELSYQLSVGAKYMFHEPANVDLIRKSWQDFNRRLRWRINFLFDKQGEQPYDPDYDVRAPSTKQAPALPHYIELGLVKGRIFVNETISKVPDVQTLRHQHKPLQPAVGSIREFLLSNNYVVTGTDKNLGIAVSKREWVTEKSQDILSDVNNYRYLEHMEAINILNEKCVEMEALARLAHEHVDHLEGTVAEFLRSKVTLRGEAHHIPKFYGIPKIHKSPVKMRPIIPCHTAIQNPAAKYVSKKLKPLIQEAATVIHGTKDLAQKLSKLALNTSRKWYIVTGDVVAFYPNIPLKHCLDIVYNMYFEHYWNISTHDNFANRKQQELFKRCLEVGNTSLMTQFQNKIYLQLNGLAMGVADSPDLANLYGYYFEKRSKVLEHPDVFYYGRYIDDCLAIVYAESEQQAVDLMSGLVKFDNCTITWDASEKFAPFLDMMLYKDVDNTLQHMPYRKHGNHQERIPWISAHPYDVKRGTFLGEMSRLATLSSKLEHYSAAMRGLVALYIHRGYPADEVHKWLYSNLSRRWDNRLADKPAPESADILVLKTQYNLAWNYFNSHQLGDTIFGYWREWLERADTGNFNNEFPPPEKRDLRTSNWGTRETEGLWDLRKTNIFNSRVILSRKRTRNLLDLTNLWKKSVMENLEEQALDDILGDAARYTALKRPLAPDINTAVVGPRLKRTRVDPSAMEEDTVEHVSRRSSSPTPTAWRNAAMGSWGRGSRI